MKQKAAFFIVALGLMLAVMFKPSHKSEDYFYSRTVKLLGNGRFCSGEQVQAPSGESYILTAAHCRPLADKDGVVDVIKEDGTHIPRKVVLEDKASDLLLLEGLPGIRGLEIAKHVYPHQHVRTYTHGRAYNTYKTEGVIIQDQQVDILIRPIQSLEDQQMCESMPKYKVKDVDSFFGPVKGCFMEVSETLTTAFITHGSSGGMVVDDDGRLVGVVSAGDDLYGCLVQLDDIKAFLKGF